VHDVVRHGLVVDALPVDLVPVITERSGAFLAIIWWVALLETQNPREPLVSGVVEILAACLDHVALAFRGTMLACERLVWILASIAIRPQAEVKNCWNARGLHRFVEISRNE